MIKKTQILFIIVVIFDHFQHQHRYHHHHHHLPLLTGFQVQLPSYR